MLKESYFNGKTSSRQEWPAGTANRSAFKYFLLNSKARDFIVYTDGSLTRRPVRIELHCRARCDHHPWIQHRRGRCNIQLDKESGSKHTCPLLDCPWKKNSRSMKLLQTVIFEKSRSANDYVRPPSTKDSWTSLTDFGILESRKITEQTDWRAKQPLQVACVRQRQKCWGFWDTTRGHKTRNIASRAPGGGKRRKRQHSAISWKDEIGLLLYI